MKEKGRRICKIICSILLILSVLFTTYIPGADMLEHVNATEVITINQTSAELIKGQSLQLEVSGTKKAVKWSTSDKKIASVDQEGYVVAKKAGTATIKAKVGKKTLSCKVTVVNEGLNYKDRTVYVGDVLQMEVLNAKDKVKWSSSKKSVATVDSKGKVTIKKKGTAIITAKTGKKTYTCKLTVQKAGITRAQWINELVKALKLTVPKKCIEYSFTDIDKSKYKNAIQTAYECGILPQTDTEEFCPNAPATREFVAYTAVKGIGADTSNAKKLTCKDKSGISYSEQVSKALDLGMLSLSKKNFYPSKEITKSNKNQTVKVVKEFVNSMTIKKNVQKVTYNDQVQQMEQSADFVVSDTTGAGKLSVTVKQGADLSKIKAGDILVLPDADNQDSVAIKVDKITTDSSGNASISGTEPSLEEVFESIDIEDTVTATMSDFVPNESVLKGVSLSNNNQTLKAQLVLDEHTLKGSTLDERISLGEDKKFSFEEDCVSGSITIEAPKLSAIIKANTDNGQDELTIEQFMVKLSDTVTGTATTSGKIADEKIMLGHLEVKLGKGFKAWLIFNAVFDAKGTATVTCTLTNAISFNYYKGEITYPIETSSSFEGTEATVDAKLYLDTNLKITWLGKWDKKKKAVKWDIEIAGMYLDAGAGVSASTKVYDAKPKSCVDLRLYPYAAIALESEKGLGKILKELGYPTSWTVLDNNADNKYMFIWHVEDGRHVEGACAHSEDVYTITLNPNGGTLGIKEVKVKANDGIVVYQIPFRNGYTFDGWYDAKIGGKRIAMRSTKAARSMTLYAHWKEAKTVGISFDENGGDELVLSIRSYEVGKKFDQLPIVSRKNYEFAGWYTQKVGGKRIYASSEVTRYNTTLYARWEKMTTPDGYWITKYTGEKKDLSYGYPSAYEIVAKKDKLILYGGICEYNASTERMGTRKGYAWREYTIASNVEIASYDESVDDEEEDAWISMDRSDLREELAELQVGTRIALKFKGGKIVKIIFIE